jgi:hypothetical protein
MGSSEAKLRDLKMAELIEKGFASMPVGSTFKLSMPPAPQPPPAIGTVPTSNPPPTIPVNTPALTIPVPTSPAAPTTTAPSPVAPAPVQPGGKTSATDHVTLRLSLPASTE